MTRRDFSGLLAGLAAFPGFASGNASPVVIFQAIAGVRLPETLAITTNSPETLRPGLWELRTYRTTESQPAALAGELTDIFPHAGIRPRLSEADGPNLTYFIPFENLTARDRAWTAVNADPRWNSARTRFQSYHFGLYRSV